MRPNDAEYEYEEPPTGGAERMCIECHGPYVIDEGEERWFLDKGLRLPRRCKPCRQARKQAGII